jgi:hypothetical protein
MPRLYSGSRAVYQVVETIKPNIFKAKVVSSGWNSSHDKGNSQKLYVAGDVSVKKRFLMPSSNADSVLIKNLRFERELKAQNVP